MGGECSTHAYRVLIGNCHFQDLGIDVRIMLNQILKGIRCDGAE
jgi:hypothetical protein